MKTILVADDDVITRKVLKGMCESLGYKVIESADGKRQAYLGPRPRFMQALSTKQSDDGDDITFSFD